MDEQQGAVEAARRAAVAADLRALIGRLRRRLQDEAPPGAFTPSQTAVLARLVRAGPATVTTLARAEGMRPQSMGAIVSALEAAGLVQGAPDPCDGRQTILSLTALAHETITAGRAAKEDWLVRTMETKLTPDEQDALARGVELLKRLVDP